MPPTPPDGVRLSGNAVFVWRSGVGFTADGALVYVGRPRSQHHGSGWAPGRAGAVRAMELDINTDWVNYSIYRPGTALGHATPANGTELLPGMAGTPGAISSPGGHVTSSPCPRPTVHEETHFFSRTWRRPSVTWPSGHRGACTDPEVMPTEPGVSWAPEAPAQAPGQPSDIPTTGSLRVVPPVEPWNVAPGPKEKMPPSDATR